MSITVGILNFVAKMLQLIPHKCVYYCGMNLKNHIPNLLTLGNLISGSIAIVFVSQYYYYTPAIFLIFLAAIFDLLDGAIARALKVSGEMGKQLDSLADVISFGLAPSVVVFKMLEETLPTHLSWMKYIAFINVACAAYRLAKFNLSTDQTHDFKGMPSPANGIFWASILGIYAWAENHAAQSDSIPMLPFTAIIILNLLTSYLMISNVRMFSFKFKKGGMRANMYPTLMLAFVVIVSITILIVYSNVILAIPLCILLYVLLSLLYHFTKSYQ